MIVGHYAAALVPYSRLEGRPLTRRRSVALYVVFAVGSLAWLPATSMSL